MPRPSLPARLWLRPAAGDREATWVIIDRRRQYSTGCGQDARAEAEQRLAEHIAAKHNPVASRRRHPNEVLVADVLSVYLDDVVPKQARPKQASDRVGRLLEWWGEKLLSDVTPQACDRYAAHRAAVERKRRTEAKKATLSAGRKSKAKEPTGSTTGGSRRDLEDLRSAINHHAKRNLHSGVVEVSLPAKGAPRPTWLSRDEVARLMWVCWRHGRTVKLPRGKRKGEMVESTFHDLRHIARFILMGVYTGSRSGAIFSASIYAGSDRSFVDLDSGIFYRLADGATETNKRQPPAPIPDRLLAHLRRWKRQGVIAQYVVEWDGMPVKSIKVGWASALALAGIDKRATPHTLRHTAATWLMQNGVDTWEAAGYLGMSEEVLRRVYGHHHPDFMRNAASAITGKRKVRRS